MNQSSQPLIFITGASRSGTTLMSFILRQHQEIHGLNELQIFGQFWVPGDAELNSAERINALSWVYAREELGILLAKPTQHHIDKAETVVSKHAGDTASLFAKALTGIANNIDKRIACEQTPRNIFYAEQLLKTYPNAHVIHMLRDPRAVTASQKNRWKRRSLATEKSNVPLLQMLKVRVNYHPYTVCKMWNKASEIADKLQHHDRFHIVSFEQLLESPKETLETLCDQIGVDFQPSMLNVRQINSSHVSGKDPKAVGLQTNAISTWRNLLSPSERQIVETRCAKWINKFGYGDNEGKPQISELSQKLAYLPHLAGVALVNPKRALIQLRAITG